MNYVLWVVLAALAALVTVVAVRTARFKPEKGGEEEMVLPELVVDTERAAESLAEMVRCRTVSSRDRDAVDEKEFQRFRDLLPKLYPKFHSTCSLTRVGDTGLVYLWKGRSSDEPSVLMAHYDVVPAEESAWDKPPFEGIIEDGVLWGRGTLDTKCTLCGALEAAERLISEGFTPEHDVYFSFAGDEETSGVGAPQIVDLLQEKGIKPALVVDEGGAVVQNVFPGVKDRCALVGIGEKGMLDLEFYIKSTGGHASAPPAHGPVGKLSQAVADMENHPFPSVIAKPVAEMFDTLGRRSTLLYRAIFANLWLFKPLLAAICKRSGGELNAMMRTTCAFTMTEASKASNVLPPYAKFTANFRIITGETVESTIERAKKTIANDEIELRAVGGQNPSIASDTSCEGYKKLSRAIKSTWRDVVVSPYLMMACSDSRHFCRISDKVMRFSAMELSAEERGLIHANNERIRLDALGETVAFYIRLESQL